MKGFVLSMIETAAALRGPALDADTVNAILDLGRTLLSHEIEILDDVMEGLEALAEIAPLALITKGDLLHQETKLAASGLAQRFTSVDIVSDKRAETFTAAFARHGLAPSEAVMIGDSMRSDILPALEAGAHAVHIPHPLAWAVEAGETPSDNPCFARVANLQEAASWVAKLG